MKTKEEIERLQEALAEFSVQWTEQFVVDSIIPNIEKAFENEYICYCLINWKRCHDNYCLDKIRAIKRRMEDSEYKYCLYATSNDYQRYSDNLYEFFAKVGK